MNDSPRSVDAALADLAMVAVARLQTEMSTAKNSKDRIAAANSILDRVGFSRTPRVQADAADQELRSALNAALANGVSPGTARELERMSQEHSDKLAEQEAEREHKKRLTRAQQQAQDQADHDERRAAAALAAEAAWEAADPGRAPMADAHMRDFSQESDENDESDESGLGPDDEETDAWLDA